MKGSIVIIDDVSGLKTTSRHLIEVQCEQCQKIRKARYCVVLKGMNLRGGKTLCRVCCGIGENSPTKRPEVKIKMSLSQQGKSVAHQTGEKSHFFGKRGPLSPRWKEDKKGTLNHLIRTSYEYKTWRKKIIQRDKKICRVCHQKKEVVQVDHIVPFDFLLKENNIKTRDEGKKCKNLWYLLNGRVICEECHLKTDTYGTKAKFFKRTKEFYMINQDVLDVAKELREILGSIKGAEQLQERFTLQFIVTVANEEARSNVENVSKMLVEQAQKLNFDLEITAATEEEILEAKKRLLSQVA